MTLITYLCVLQLLICFLYVNAMKLYIRFSQGGQVQTRYCAALHTRSCPSVVLTCGCVWTVASPEATNDVKYVTVEFLQGSLQHIADTLNPIVVWTINACRCRNNLTTVKVTTFSGAAPPSRLRPPSHPCLCLDAGDHRSDCGVPNRPSVQWRPALCLW